MGTITKIEQQKNKNRVNIFIDNDFFCGLEKETAIIFGLKVGKQVDEAYINEAVIASEKKRAFEKAIDYLSIRMHTKRELFLKLQKKGFDENSINGAFEKLEEYNYIDDYAFAKEYVNQNTKYSKLVIKNKLMQKGIKSSIIDEVLNDFEKEDEIKICKKFAEKYLKSKNFKLSDDKQKIIASLSRKGFKFDIISRAIKELNLEIELDNFPDDYTWL